MTKTRKLWFVGSVFAAVAVQGLLAMTVKTGPGGFGPYQKSSGGEFTFSLLSGYADVNLAAYVQGVTKNVSPANNPTIQSFCLERNEYLNGNTTYQATIDDMAINGGLGGGNPDYLSIATAWLYREFATGKLVGYDYSNARSTVADLVNAIWYLESEPASLSSTAQTFLNNAYAANGGAVAAMANNWDGTVRKVNVRVMNLLDSKGTPSQSQLVMVPDGGMTVVLLGMALGGMGLIARRFRK